MPKGKRKGFSAQKEIGIMYKIAGLKVNIPEETGMRELAQPYLINSDELAQPCLINNDELAQPYLINNGELAKPCLIENDEQMSRESLQSAAPEDKTKSVAESCDVNIDAKQLEPHMWENIDEFANLYLQSGDLFYRRLLAFDGMMLHASCVKYQGKAYMFSGPCGAGKSTHSALWIKHFDGTTYINDDKPALRLIKAGEAKNTELTNDGEDNSNPTDNFGGCEWYAFGTPWCGKDYINTNDSAPIGGICFIKQGEGNSIRQLSAEEIIPMFLEQTVHKLSAVNMIKLLDLLGQLINAVPFYELTCEPTLEAAELSRKTMVK